MKKGCILRATLQISEEHTLLHIAGFFMPVLPYPGMALGPERDAPRSL